MRKLLCSPWQTLSIPFALTPIGQLHQSPPSPAFLSFSRRWMARHFFVTCIIGIPAALSPPGIPRDKCHLMVSWKWSRSPAAVIDRSASGRWTKQWTYLMDPEVVAFCWSLFFCSFHVSPSLLKTCIHAHAHTSCTADHVVCHRM